jgi:hypothetical protein
LALSFLPLILIFLLSRPRLASQFIFSIDPAQKGICRIGQKKAVIGSLSVLVSPPLLHVDGYGGRMNTFQMAALASHCPSRAM